MVRELVAEEVRELKAAPGGDLVVGGAEVNIRLVETRAFGNGVVLLRYLQGREIR